MRSGKRVGGYIDYFLQTKSRIIHSHNSQARVMVSPLPTYSTHRSTTSNHHPLQTTTIISISIHANNSTTTFISISINANSSINTYWCPIVYGDFPLDTWSIYYRDRSGYPSCKPAYDYRYGE
jgi:hypothetical protein